MAAILKQAVQGEGAVLPELRVRLASLAMRHRVYANRVEAVGVFAPYTRHEDAEIAEKSFHWGVTTRLTAAQPVAENAIAELKKGDRYAEATKRLTHYLSTFGITVSLAKLFRTDESESTRMLASSPGGRDVEPLDDLVADIADASPLVRRNAAMRAAVRKGDRDAVRVACRRALAVESDRDARLAFLVALFEPSGDESSLPDACLPVTPLEQAVWEGLRRGLVCVDRFGSVRATRLKPADPFEDIACETTSRYWV